MPMTPGPWRLGRVGGCVVSDNPVNDGPRERDTGHGDVEYYGGFLICESILKKDDALVIASVPELIDLAKIGYEVSIQTSMIRGMNDRVKVYQLRHRAIMERLKLRF